MSAQNLKRGLLLLNLGTPDSPAPKDVGRYLREFLMDPFVVDIAWPLRWTLVNALVVPRRKIASGKLYETIWTERGSPLLYHLKDLRDRVEEEYAKAGVPKPALIEIAMRYGQPKISAAFEAFEKAGVDEVVILPLYPQYAESSTRSSIEACQKVAAELNVKFKLKFVPPFYTKSAYIDSYVKLVRDAFEREKPEHLVMSFHGIPERQIKRTDLSPERNYCLANANCCAEINEANRDCYRAQCFASARLIAKGAGLTNDQYTVTFQSRLGRTVWIRPYTDVVIPELAKRGVKRLAVVCPSFVADCLETLEENDVRGREAFEGAGGDHFTAIPCPNSDANWAKGVVELASESL